MIKKYQTSFEYQVEEKRMNFLKLLLAVFLIVVGCLVVYGIALPSEKRMNWYNEGLEQAKKYYIDGATYASKYVPLVGDITGIKYSKTGITRAENQVAPLKAEPEKVKVYRSNQIQ